MSLLKEFKEFAVKGNVIDLAVAVIIGAAFGKIVTSLVNDLVMPVAGALGGGGDFSNYKWIIKQATETTPETALLYGNFIQTVVNFLIISISVFMMVKLINTVKRRYEKEQAEAAPAAPPQDVVLLTEIRDLLKK